MAGPQNDSEAYVAALCERSFLPLWSYPNPTGKKGKELCDLLVVCGRDVAIVSVKDIRPSPEADEPTRTQRWVKKAIDGSFRQLAGAERWLRTESRVTDADGARAVDLPPLDERRVYRIALAFGGEGAMPLKQGDFGSGFMHAMDEQAFDKLIRELDTATDFFDYLRQKEDLVSRATLLFEGAEEDLLAFYLSQNRSFPEEISMMVVGEGMWEAFSASAENQARLRANEISYVWDRIIEEHIDGFRNAPRPAPPSFVDAAATVWQAERVLRIMAQEDRYWRRELSTALVEVIRPPDGRPIRSRFAISPERRVTYVFLRLRGDEDVEARTQELFLRCWVARDQFPDHPVVVGMMFGTAPGDPNEMLLLDQTEWGEDQREKAQLIRDELGYFASPRERRSQGREFPISDDE